MNNNKIKVISGVRVKTINFNIIKLVKFSDNAAIFSYDVTTGGTKELVIKEHGACDFYALEAFIAHFIKHYSVGTCSDGTLTAVADSLYHVVKSYHHDKNIGAIIIDNLRNFQLPTHTHLNRDEDFQCPSPEFQAMISAQLAAAVAGLRH